MTSQTLHKANALRFPMGAAMVRTNTGVRSWQCECPVSEVSTCPVPQPWTIEAPLLSCMLLYCVTHLSWSMNVFFFFLQINFAAMESKLYYWVMDASTGVSPYELCQNKLLFQVFFPLSSEHIHAAVLAKSVLEKSHKMWRLKSKARFLKTIRDWDWNWYLFQ